MGYKLYPNAKLGTHYLLKGQIICAFSNTVRINEFNKTLKSTLWSTTVKATIRIFLFDPALDNDG